MSEISRETIEYFNKRIEVEKQIINLPTCDKDVTSIKKKHIECFKYAIQCIEKQIPKKIEVKNSIHHYCPSCDLYFDSREWKSKYCGRCGQAIKWE